MGIDIIQAQDNDEFLVEKVLSHRVSSSKKKRLAKKDYFFTIKWVEYVDPSEEQWNRSMTKNEPIIEYCKENGLRIFY